MNLEEVLCAGEVGIQYTEVLHGMKYINHMNAKRSEDQDMTLTERITKVLQQRKIMQEQLKDRRRLCRQRLEAICNKPDMENRVIVFEAGKRV